mmetsp:Transcript_25747/g.41577  ORF Transcript_25747/g.41577 Transcript_25747/m.41577 type:complete len:130 (+) Transcript_25747:2612-3001(+)
MVIVTGLDRTDDHLTGMPDELWGKHTEEIMEDFKQQEKLGFTEFCALYANGTKVTAAMKIFAEMKNKDRWPELVGKTPEDAKACIRRERPDIVDIDFVQAGACVTEDYCFTRVRIFIDSNIVSEVPMVG